MRILDSFLLCVAVTTLAAVASRASLPATHGQSIASNRTLSSTLIDPRFTLECHRREYTFKAVRYDDVGRKCWQFVTVMSCWGRCDSGEVRLGSFFPPA